MDYRKGDKVVITECSEYQKETYKYDVGYTGIINEDKETGEDVPWILFDNKEANYTKKGTSVGEYQFKIANN